MAAALAVDNDFLAALEEDQQTHPADLSTEGLHASLEKDCMLFVMHASILAVTTAYHVCEYVGVVMHVM